MAELDDHLAYLRQEYESACAAPLSARRARLVAALVDAYADRLFAVLHTGGGADLLRYRTALADRSPALRMIFAMCAAREDSPRLVVGAERVPLSQYGDLDLADFMVSIYNEQTVQRLRIVTAAEQVDAHEALGQAIAELASATPQ